MSGMGTFVLVGVCVWGGGGGRGGGGMCMCVWQGVAGGVTITALNTYNDLYGKCPKISNTLFHTFWSILYSLSYLYFLV